MADESAPATRTHLAGHELTATLHVGTKALVYRGRKGPGSPTVVLKTQRSDQPSHSALRRLQSEFELLGSIQDSRVVRAHDLLSDGNRTVLVVEDPGGAPLRRLLDSGPLPLSEALHLGAELAEALAAIHQAGVMHKDINPSNVLVLPAGAGLRLIDFDIASRAPRETRLAVPPRALEGTLAYLAPEQTGRVNRSVDGRADLYALGVTLFEMATGKLPFDATDPMQLLHAHIARRPSPPSIVRAGLPPAFDGIVLRLLEKRPEDRYQSAFGVAADLRHLRWRLDAGAAPEEVDFEPGRWDRPLRFQVPERLYGREDEVSRLLLAFQQAAAGHAGLALVAGDPGAGKSRLIAEIRRPIVERDGRFIAGKFDQFKREVPFASLTQALRTLAQQLLAESPERLSTVREALREKLGPNAGVLHDLLPELEQLLGPAPELPELAPTEAQNRFQEALSGFVELFCQPDQPLCLILDDLQWADGATLLWLEKTLSRPGARHFFIVAAYRAGEVQVGHPFLGTISRIEQANVPVEWLEIAPLTPDTVDRLTADALGRTVNEARPLSQLVYRKTHGNPFFMMQCLESLAESRAIDWSDTQRAFEFDLSRAAQAPIAENVVDFMVDRLRRLPEATQGILRVAACLGNTFAFSSLRAVSSRTEAAVLADLAPAVAEGLILHRDAADGADDEYFAFQHDRVQQAAYALVPENDRALLHVSIARTLVSRMATPETDDGLFDALGHFTAAGPHLMTNEERRGLAALYLAGAERARRSTAFGPGLNFARRGLTLCGESMPRPVHRSLALEEAELLHLTGDDPGAERSFQTALTLADSALERAAVRERQVHFHTNKADFRAAYDIGRAAVGELGFSLPASFVPPLLVKDVLRVMWRLRGRPVASLADLPTVTDPRVLAASRLLGVLLKAAYQIRPELCVHNAALGVLMALKHGNASESALSYMVFGCIFVGGIVGRHVRGHAFGQLALTLVEKFQSPWMRAEVQFVNGYFATSWLKPARDAEALWRQAWQSGVDAGDFFHAGCAASGLTQSLFMRGAPLPEVQAEIDRLLPFLERIGNRENVGTLRGIRRCVELLAAGPEKHAGFDAPNFDTAAYEADLATWGSRHFAHHWFIDKAAVQLCFGEAEAALATLRAAAPLLKDSQGMLHAVHHRFWDALASAYLTPASAAVPRALSRTIATLTPLANRNPANFAAPLALLKAEVARIRGQADAALAYEDAASRAALDAMFPLEALAQSRCAELHLASGRASLARHAVGEAVYALRRWGAHTLAARLLARHPELAPNLTQGGATLRASTKSTHGGSHSGTLTEEMGSALDLASVIKAAEAMSSEVQLKALLERLLTLVMENAGADRGALVLLEKGELWVQASALHGGDVVVERVPLAASEVISPAAVQLAVNTLAVVVEDDAAQTGRLVADPHVRSEGVRSVLALPLLNRGTLRAVLYLENRLVTGAFTHERVAPLRVLSGPMAISLDNALLWDSLERTYQATRRFVPFEFLEAIGRSSLVEVSRGDHAQLVTTVMFVDLRGFTTLCEGMSPADTYTFINEYLAHVEPCISNHGGFIQHFLGDGILALFCRQSSPDDACLAALDLMRAVEHFNTERATHGHAPIHIGIGMNTGPLMLGTIGGRERLDANVIGDAVNLAARVEGQSKNLGPVILTESTYAGLADPSRLSLREVDRVIVKGRSGAVSLYELCTRPRPSAEPFARALHHFRQGDMDLALQGFEAACQADATDLAAALHTGRARLMLVGGVPDDWNGVVRLDAK